MNLLANALDPDVYALPKSLLSAMVERRSASESLQSEQAQVVEAVMRSKAELASQTDCMDVVILHYSQSKEWFCDCFSNGKVISEVDALLQAGKNPVLMSGAKAVVPPELFPAVAV